MTWDGWKGAEKELSGEGRGVAHVGADAPGREWDREGDGFCSRQRFEPGVLGRKWGHWTFFFLAEEGSP